MQAIACIICITTNYLVQHNIYIRTAGIIQHPDSKGTILNQGNYYKGYYEKPFCSSVHICGCAQFIALFIMTFFVT